MGWRNAPFQGSDPSAIPSDFISSGGDPVAWAPGSTFVQLGAASQQLLGRLALQLAVRRDTMFEMSSYM